MESAEEFAKEIISLAKSKGLSVYEICKAADMAQEIACKSVFEGESMESINNSLFLLSFVRLLADYKSDEYGGDKCDV